MGNSLCVSEENCFLETVVLSTYFKICRKAEPLCPIALNYAGKVFDFFNI